MPLEPGSSASVDLDVGDDDTAIAMHSGSVPCLATPRVIALSEEACILVIEGRLADGATTVGQRVQVDHLAPTPVGQRVTAEATLEAVQGRRLTFTVSVNDDRGLVAVGRVTRVIVDTERFLDKLN
ncbi:MAG TPA: hotdog domain-containing protein [Acidimicrobiales bacterium]